eukprot:COSAG01_NODE_4630_length_4863_cov_3.556255_6_plen_206_part_00
MEPEPEPELEPQPEPPQPDPDALERVLLEQRNVGNVGHLLDYIAETLLSGTTSREELMKDETLIAFFKKATEMKPRTKKTPIERAKTPYNSDKCIARIWAECDKEELVGSGYPRGKTGYAAVQCNSQKKEGQMCARCAKKTIFNFGKMNEDIPKDVDNIILHDKWGPLTILNNTDGTVISISDLPKREKKSSRMPLASRSPNPRN